MKIVAATSTQTHIDCSCHQLNTSIDTVWKKLLLINADLLQLNSYCQELVKYINQAYGIQSCLSTTLKQSSETRPWRSLRDMFSSIAKSRTALLPLVKDRKKEHMVLRVHIDLLNKVVAFLVILPSLFDVLEYANIPTLQNVCWCTILCMKSGSPKMPMLKQLHCWRRNFINIGKVWTMLHFIASYLDPTLKEFRFVKNVSDRDGYF